MRAIDVGEVLDNFNKLEESPWFYSGTNIDRMVRKEAIEVLRDLCVRPCKTVESVKHGRWDGDHNCTMCGEKALSSVREVREIYDYDWEENLVPTGQYEVDLEYFTTDYCPHCGARMDEVSE